MIEYPVTQGSGIPGRYNFKIPPKPFHLSSSISSTTERQLCHVSEIYSSNAYILQIRNGGFAEKRLAHGHFYVTLHLLLSHSWLQVVHSSNCELNAIPRHF